MPLAVRIRRTDTPKLQSLPTVHEPAKSSQNGSVLIHLASLANSIHLFFEIESYLFSQSPYCTRQNTWHPSPALLSVLFFIKIGTCFVCLFRCFKHLHYIYCMLSQSVRCGHSVGSEWRNKTRPEANGGFIFFAKQIFRENRNTL